MRFSIVFFFLGIIHNLGQGSCSGLAGIRRDVWHTCVRHEVYEACPPSTCYLVEHFESPRWRTRDGECTQATGVVYTRYRG